MTAKWDGWDCLRVPIFDQRLWPELLHITFQA